MHKPVLLNEVIDLLNIKPTGRYIDGTLGFGGHAQAIVQRLEHPGQLLGLDVDPYHMERAKDRLQPFEDRTITRLVNFRGLQGVLDEIGWSEVDGMIFDLGVSSHHLDNPERGFSFQAEGPLDMRLSSTQSETVLSKLAQADEETLINLFRDFGEYQNVRRLARYLHEDVTKGRIKTTQDLAHLCKRLLKKRGRSHPATRVFLALRCWLNEELQALQDLLHVAPNHLKIGGRLIILSYHSLEDRLIKERFRDLSSDEMSPLKFKLLSKKPLLPVEKEIAENPRARSAKLRGLERTA